MSLKICNKHALCILAAVVNALRYLEASSNNSQSKSLHWEIVLYDLYERMIQGQHECDSFLNEGSYLKI